MNIKDFYAKEGEQPLDNILSDGGFVGIMRTIGVIGDSLSSGELESYVDGKRGCHDYYDISWGQYIARATGSTVYNFSRGGMTAKQMWESYADKCGLWTEDKKCQAYIVALGVNDIANRHLPVGSVDEIDLENPENNPDTVMGNLCRIMSKIKNMQPKARFFFVTMPRDCYKPFDEASEIQTKMCYDIASLYEYSYVIDLNKYGPVHDEEFKRNFYMSSHLNASGYLLTAKIIMSYIDYIIRHNPEDFMNFGFVGRTTRYNENYKY